MTLLANCQVDTHHWKHSKHNPTTTKLDLNEIANTVLEENNFLKYRQLIQHPEVGEQWRHSSSNEFGRLSQGIGGRIKGTNTINFIPKHQVPEDRIMDVTYEKIVCNLRPEKDEVHRTRFVIQGNRINYPGNI